MKKTRSGWVRVSPSKSSNTSSSSSSSSSRKENLYINIDDISPTKPSSSGQPTNWNVKPNTGIHISKNNSFKRVGTSTSNGIRPSTQAEQQASEQRLQQERIQRQTIIREQREKAQQQRIGQANQVQTDITKRGGYYVDPTTKLGYSSREDLTEKGFIRTATPKDIRGGRTAKVEGLVYGEEGVEEYNKEVKRIEEESPKQKYISTKTGEVYEEKISVKLGSMELTPEEQVKVYVDPKTNEPILDIKSYLEEKKIPYSSKQEKIKTPKEFMERISSKPTYSYNEIKDEIMLSKSYSESKEKQLKKDIEIRQSKIRLVTGVGISKELAGDWIKEERLNQKKSREMIRNLEPNISKGLKNIFNFNLDKSESQYQDLMDNVKESSDWLTSKGVPKFIVKGGESLTQGTLKVIKGIAEDAITKPLRTVGKVTTISTIAYPLGIVSGTGWGAGFASATRLWGTAKAGEIITPAIKQSASDIGGFTGTGIGVVAELIPTTTTEVLLIGGAGKALKSQNKFIRRGTKLLFTEEGVRGAMDKDLNMEKRIASGIIGVGSGLSLGVEIAKAYNVPTKFKEFRQSALDKTKKSRELKNLDIKQLKSDAFGMDAFTDLEVVQALRQVRKTKGFEPTVDLGKILGDYGAESAVKILEKRGGYNFGNIERSFIKGQLKNKLKNKFFELSEVQQIAIKKAKSKKPAFEWGLDKTYLQEKAFMEKKKFDSGEKLIVWDKKQQGFRKIDTKPRFKKDTGIKVKADRKMWGLEQVQKPQEQILKLKNIQTHQLQLESLKRFKLSEPLTKQLTKQEPVQKVIIDFKPKQIIQEVVKTYQKPVSIYAGKGMYERTDVISRLSQTSNQFQSTKQFSININFIKQSQISSSNLAYPNNLKQQLQPNIFKTNTKSRLDFYPKSIQRSKSNQNLQFAQNFGQNFGQAVNSNVDLKFRQPQRFAQSSKQAQLSFQRLRFKEKQFQELKFRESKTPRVFKMFSSQDRRTRKPILKEVGTYAVQVRRGGKFKGIGTDLTLGQAMKLGKRRTQSTLARTFKVVRTGRKKKIKADEVGFSERDLKMFRGYKVKKGKKIDLGSRTFIQKAPFALGSRGETKELQRFRKIKLNKLINF